MNMHSKLEDSSRRVRLLLSAAIICLLAFGFNPATADEGQVVVRVLAGTDALQLAADHDCTVKRHVEGTDLYEFRSEDGSDLKSVLRVLQQDSRVSYAEPNLQVAQPEVTGGQLHYAYDRTRRSGSYSSQSALNIINMSNSQKFTTGRGVIVAVLDTGVALDHPALTGRIVPGFNALSPGEDPVDLADGPTNSGVGHGTMVAGIIALISPNASIMPVRVLNAEGIGTTMTVVNGLRWAVDHGAKVVNLSLGTLQRSSALEEEISHAMDAGVLIVASAGNQGGLFKQFPAAYGDVIAVASIESNLTKSDYSNFGKHIVVVAPGTGIRSTYYDGGYATWSGTSFAAPMISGEAALLLAMKPGMTGSKVKEAIEESARSVAKANATGLRGMLGHGLIDVARAVKRVANGSRGT